MCQCGKSNNVREATLDIDRVCGLKIDGGWKLMVKFPRDEKWNGRCWWDEHIVNELLVFEEEDGIDPSISHWWQGNLVGDTSDHQYEVTMAADRQYVGSAR